MGVTKKMVVECTCDMCKRPCGEYDNRIYYETDSGDRDVSPHTSLVLFTTTDPTGLRMALCARIAKLSGFNDTSTL